MREETLIKRLLRIYKEILDIKVVKIVVGKHKKPIDKPDEIIFHIDI